MTMKLQQFFIVAAILMPLSALAATKSRSLQYHPEGRDIVCVNGKNRYTRALYGGYTDFRVETSDRPIFGTYRGKSHRNIRFRLILNGKTTQLENTAHCEARYHAGMRTYQLSDPAFGKGILDITALAMPDTEAGIWRFQCSRLPADATLECIVCDIKAKSFNRWGDMNADPRDGFDPAPDETNKQTFTWNVGKGTSYAMVAVDEKGEYSISVPKGAEAQALFDKAMKHHDWLANQIIFDTPDPLYQYTWRCANGCCRWCLGRRGLAAWCHRVANDAQWMASRFPQRCSRPPRPCHLTFHGLRQQSGDRR